MANIDRRKVIWIAVGAATLVLLVLAFRPRPIAVETAKVAKGPMTVTVDARGETRVLDRYVVTAPVAGNLERLPLRPGDMVTKGDVVARLAPSSLSGVGAMQARAGVAQAEAAVREAEAAAASARTRSNLAATEQRRTAALEAQGIASQEAIDRARAEAEATRREVDAANASVAQARANLASARATLAPATPGGSGTIEIRSPVSARVFNIPERSGRAVMPGETILTLGNPSEIEARIEVLSQDAVKVRNGARAMLVDWGGPQPLPGIVRTVESSAFTKISALGIEEQRVFVIVALKDPPPQLGDGYRVQGRIVIWESPATVQLPVGALTRFDELWGVFAVDDGVARKRLIEIDHRNEHFAEVTKGLSEGDVVIVHPGDKIADGVRVAAENE